MNTLELEGVAQTKKEQLAVVNRINSAWNAINVARKRNDMDIYTYYHFTPEYRNICISVFVIGVQR